MTRWRFADTTSSETWTFVRNPFEMASTVQPHRTTGAPHGLALRPGDMPFAWTFRGHLKSQEEYAALLAWSVKPAPIRITDHLGRIHRVLPQGFDPKPRRSRPGRHWRFEYTFKALYLERET